MRYGFVSDVHGNLEALHACLAYLDAQQVDRLVFLGDAVGYGANPNEVCDLLRARCDGAVLGNHDAAVVGRMDMGYYYAQARTSLLWCQKRLSAANRAWLLQLPYTLALSQDPALLLCHGSPRRPEAFEYLVQPAQVERLLPIYDDLATVTFIGHSHLALSFVLHPAVDGQPPHVSSQVGGPIACGGADKHIITVGSVGQPRDHDPRACCGIYDASAAKFTYQRLPYDHDQARAKIIAAGLPTMFGDRLLQGV